MTEFQQYFHETFADHMFLLEMSQDTFVILPPNQCDYRYTLNKISDDEWLVKTEKYDFDMDMKYTTRYKRTIDEPYWIIVKK